MAEWRKWCGQERIGDPLVGDGSHVMNPEAALTLCAEQIFAPYLET
jgi:hypothetical protein